MSGAQNSSSKPKENKTSTEMGYKVELWLYDLSHGMAKAMSPQLLGKQIDGVWHTGVVVYGYEYYYGGGIQATHPGMTQAGNPVQKIELGVTEIPQDIFHEYLLSIASDFTPQKYNIMTNNCNNFSDTVATFLLDKPIPKFITGLPNEALNTPMGQMLRPMLENMQNQMGGMVPWGEIPINLPPINNSPAMVPVKREGKESKTDKKEQKTAPPPAKELHTHTKLLMIKEKMSPSLHKDKMAPKYVKLVISYSAKVEAKNSAAGLSKEEKEALEAISTSLTKSSVAIPLTVTGAILKLLAKWPSKLLFPVIGVYQAILLRPQQGDELAKNYNAVIPHLLKLIPPQGTSVKSTIQVASICLFCNMFSSSKLAKALVNDEKFMEMVVSTLENKNDLIRMSGARLAYNAALNLPKDGSDGVAVLGSILPNACQEEVKTSILQSLLQATGALMYNNLEACEVIGAMEFEATPLVEKYKGKKVYPKLAALAKDIDSMAEASLLD
ncbi:hypothetical protein AAMO2058_001519300 [Amorphochlora amoebiformis]